MPANLFYHMKVMYQSTSSNNIPPGRPQEIFLSQSKALPRGKSSLQKHGPWDKIEPTPRGIIWKI